MLSTHLLWTAVVALHVSLTTGDVYRYSSGHSSANIDVVVGPEPPSQNQALVDASRGPFGYDCTSTCNGQVAEGSKCFGRHETRCSGVQNWSSAISETTLVLICMGEHKYEQSTTSLAQSRTTSCEGWFRVYSRSEIKRSSYLSDILGESSTNRGRGRGRGRGRRPGRPGRPSWPGRPTGRPGRPGRPSRPPRRPSRPSWPRPRPPIRPPTRPPIRPPTKPPTRPPITPPITPPIRPPGTKRPGTKSPVSEFDVVVKNWITCGTEHTWHSTKQDVWMASVATTSSCKSGSINKFVILGNENGASSEVFPMGLEEEVGSEYIPDSVKDKLYNLHLLENPGSMDLFKEEGHQPQSTNPLQFLNAYCNNQLASLTGTCYGQMRIESSGTAGGISTSETITCEGKYHIKGYQSVCDGAATTRLEEQGTFTPKGGIHRRRLKLATCKGTLVWFTHTMHASGPPSKFRTICNGKETLEMESNI